MTTTTSDVVTGPGGRGGRGSRDPRALGAAHRAGGVDLALELGVLRRSGPSLKIRAGSPVPYGRATRRLAAAGRLECWTITQQLRALFDLWLGLTAGPDHDARPVNGDPSRAASPPGLAEARWTRWGSVPDKIVRAEAALLLGISDAAAGARLDAARTLWDPQFDPLAEPVADAAADDDATSPPDPRLPLTGQHVDRGVLRWDQISAIVDATQGLTRAECHAVEQLVLGPEVDWATTPALRRHLRSAVALVRARAARVAGDPPDPGTEGIGAGSGGAFSASAQLPERQVWCGPARCDQPGVAQLVATLAAPDAAMIDRCLDDLADTLAAADLAAADLAAADLPATDVAATDVAATNHRAADLSVGGSSAGMVTRQDAPFAAAAVRTRQQCRTDALVGVFDAISEGFAVTDLSDVPGLVQHVLRGRGTVTARATAAAGACTHCGALPDAAHPDATHPDAAHPDATHPDATQPDAAHPDAAHPDATQPDAKHPDATHPDATHPGDEPAAPPSASPPLANRRAGRRRRRREVLVTMPLGTALGLSADPGHLTGYGPLPARMAAAVAATGTWRCAVTDPVHGTLLGLGTSTHSPEYAPGSVLARHVTARDEVCAWPGCHRTRTEVDHRTKHRHGGPTCECNTHALCRTHHELKDHLGGAHVVTARASRETPTTTRWTLRSGHHVDTRPPRLHPPDPAPPF